MTGDYKPGCSGKAKHTTEADALAVLHSHWRTPRPGGASLPAHVYACPHGNHFHLTSKDQARYQEDHAA
jgi:hypothetical protein